MRFQTAVKKAAPDGLEYNLVYSGSPSIAHEVSGLGAHGGD
jgi:hypothetical protein